MQKYPDNIVIHEMGEKELSKVLKIAVDEIYYDASLQEISEWITAVSDVSGSNLYSPWYTAKNSKTGEIVGFIEYGVQDLDYTDRRVVLNISLLAVKSNSQGRGVGSTLVKTSLDMVCKKWNEHRFKPIMLRVETDEQRQKARKFYEKVLENPQRIIVKDVWRPNVGTVLYFKKLVPGIDNCVYEQN